MSAIEPSLDPKAPGALLFFTKAEAAQAELETAIQLWFHNADCIPLLHLATAANDCYRALGGHKGHKSVLETWYKSQSNRVQDELRYAQNFIKHGRQDLTKKAKLWPRHIEVLILDSIHCHQHLHKGQMTPLMSFFATRFSFENPGLFASETEAFFRQQFEVYDLVEGSRTEFFNKALERLRTVIAEKPRVSAHWSWPPLEIRPETEGELP